MGLLSAASCSVSYKHGDAKSIPVVQEQRLLLVLVSEPQPEGVQTEGAVGHTIKVEGKQTSVDLCETHAEPLQAILRAVQQAPQATTPKKPQRRSKAPSRGSKRGAGTQLEVTPMEDVKRQVVTDPFTAP